MIEVELKVSIDRKDIPKFKDNLEKLGFKLVKRQIEEDLYFNGIDRDFRKTDEALRVRKTVNLDDDKDISYKITYKGPKLDKISKTREEIEVSVDDYNGAIEIFKKLGLKPVRPIKKKRELYKNKDITISIDDVTSVGTFVEFEKVVSNKDETESARNELLNLMKSLNINTDKSIKKSYLEMRDYNEKLQQRK